MTPQKQKMSKSDAAAIQTGVRAMLDCRRAAFDRFVEAIASLNPAVDARRVAAFYIAEKLAKYNGMDYRVSHGAYLDRDVLDRANKMAV